MWKKRASYYWILVILIFSRIFSTSFDRYTRVIIFKINMNFFHNTKYFESLYILFVYVYNDSTFDFFFHKNVINGFPMFIIWNSSAYIILWKTAINEFPTCFYTFRKQFRIQKSHLQYWEAIPQRCLTLRQN